MVSTGAGFDVLLSSVARFDLYLMKNEICSVCCLALLAMASGCVTSPPADAAALSAYSVGDRAGVMFDEIVVS